MIDRRGFLTSFLAVAAGAALAQGAADAAPAPLAHPRRRWRGSAPDMRLEANAADVGDPVTPNHRRGRGRGGKVKQTTAKASERPVVAELDHTARAPRVRGAARRAPEL